MLFRLSLSVRVVQPAAGATSTTIRSCACFACSRCRQPRPSLREWRKDFPRCLTQSLRTTLDGSWSMSSGRPQSASFCSDDVSGKQSWRNRLCLSAKLLLMSWRCDDRPARGSALKQSDVSRRSGDSSEQRRRRGFKLNSAKQNESRHEWSGNIEGSNSCSVRQWRRTGAIVRWKGPVPEKMRRRQVLWQPPPGGHNPWRTGIAYIGGTRRS
mmetsp:Transcript_53865/g.101172  ORF Transcript_53865/g.101172 Transcript_53865/m.101172 type:complete len:212 (-) Transcript_53865:359-994(-)